jgi:hypothetical protein
VSDAIFEHVWRASGTSAVIPAEQAGFARERE